VIDTLRRHAWWLVPLLVADAVVLALWLRHRGPERPAAEPPAAEAQAPAPPRSQLANLLFPTDQTRLLDPDPAGVFQPTASGHPESALYGSVRTGQTGKMLHPRFHEGIDIAALERDRASRPLDRVYAVADGRIAFVNPHPGNSDYGKYIVLTHDDPVGTVYTLYAHLASVGAGLRPGADVEAGAVLGVMGNTALDPIPMARAHLHFEVGLIQNSRFESWARRHHDRAPGGIYNGLNLFAVDPLEVFRAARSSAEFSMASYLSSAPSAFEVAVDMHRPWDFFERYPGLWRGGPFAPGPAVVSVAESGLPLAARPTLSGEAEGVGRLTAVVRNVDEGVLGRNGRRLIGRKDGRWELTEHGKRWLELLSYRP
jgi:murein DD-endopeptidase MepM/ murein hydrolase activator NlpD